MDTNKPHRRAINFFRKILINIMNSESQGGQRLRRLGGFHALRGSENGMLLYLL